MNLLLKMAALKTLFHVCMYRDTSNCWKKVVCFCFLLFFLALIWMRSRLVSICFTILLYCLLSLSNSFNPDPRIRHTFVTLVFGGMFSGIPVYCVSQMMVQRVLAGKSQRAVNMWDDLSVLWNFYCSCFCLPFLREYITAFV